MSDSIILDQKLIAASLLSDYSLISDTFPAIDEETFKNSDDATAKLLLRSIISSDDFVDLMFKKFKKEEIAAIVSSDNGKATIIEFIEIEKVYTALLLSISKAETFLAAKASAGGSGGSSGSGSGSGPPPPPPPPPPPTAAYKTRAEIEAWRTAANNKTNPIKSVDETSNYLEDKYELDFDNAKSLFLSLVLAVPELLNQLILNYNFKDDGDEFSGVVDVATIDAYKTEFQTAIDTVAPNEELIDIISVLAFVCFGKLIAEWQHIIDMAGITSSDPRKFMCSVILSVAGIGIEVNKDELDKEVWGRPDKVIKGVSIEFDPDNNIINVIVDKVFVQRHTHYEEYEGWLPSSFYTKYTRHGSTNITSVLRDDHNYWKEVLFENYDTKMSSKSIVRYIASKHI